MTARSIDNDWTWVNDVLRYRARTAATRKAAFLTRESGRDWTTQYHPETARWHVVLDDTEQHGRTA